MKLLFVADLSLNWLTKLKTDEEICTLYSDVMPYFNGADFTVLNMENMFGNPAEYTPISKIGPNLITDVSFAAFVDALNPNIVNFANNHAGDYGPELVTDMLDLFRKKGYITIGAGANINEAYTPAYLEKNDVKVGIIGVCENEFGIATCSSPGSAGLNLGKLSNAILTVKKNGALPIVYIHAGNEFNPFPSPNKVELYRHLIDFGAKAVIGMHTHCPQAYEKYHDGVIVYSMGNFYFPRDAATYPATCDKSWFYGYMSELDIDNDNIKLSTVPYHFTSKKIEVLTEEKLAEFNKYMQVLTKPLSQPNLLQKWFDAWCMYRGTEYIKRANYCEKMLLGNPDDIKPLKSIFSCEAHNELVGNTAKIIFESRQDTASELIPYIKKLQNMEYTF